MGLSMQPLWILILVQGGIQNTFSNAGGGWSVGQSSGVVTFTPVFGTFTGPASVVTASE